MKKTSRILSMLLIFTMVGVSGFQISLAAKTVEYGANWSYGYNGMYAFSNLYSSKRSHSATTCWSGCVGSGTKKAGVSANSGKWVSWKGAEFYYNIW